MNITIFRTYLNANSSLKLCDIERTKNEFPVLRSADYRSYEAGNLNPRLCILKVDKTFMLTDVERLINASVTERDVEDKFSV